MLDFPNAADVLMLKFYIPKHAFSGELISGVRLGLGESLLIVHRSPGLAENGP